MHIYALINPVSREVRYVGQTAHCLLRLRSHITESISVKAPPYNRQWAYRSPKAKWIRKLLRSGLAPAMAIVEEVDREEANERELAWIATFRSIHARLTNAPHPGFASRLKPRIRRLTRPVYADGRNPILFPDDAGVFLLENSALIASQFRREFLGKKYRVREIGNFRHKIYLLVTDRSPGHAKA
jgi:hypothetical protein